MSSNPFPMAAGYGNFPNGVFSPDLYSPTLLEYSKKISVVDNITNNEYEGTIKAQGDTVHIRKAPQVTVKSYTRGAKIEFQDVEDSELTLVVDQANVVAYKFDDIFLQQTDANYEAALADSAKYELRDAYDSAILTNIAAAVDSANIVGATGSRKAVGYKSTDDFTPLNALARLGRLLNQANAPTVGRWAVVDPTFVEALQQETGLLSDYSKNTSGSLVLDLGVMNRPINGFTLFMSNNCPSGQILAGTTRAYATAQTILKTEIKQLPDEFGYGTASLHVFGDTVLRAKELASMWVSIDTEV